MAQTAVKCRKAGPQVLKSDEGKSGKKNDFFFRNDFKKLKSFKMSYTKTEITSLGLQNENRERPSKRKELRPCAPEHFQEQVRAALFAPVRQPECASNKTST